MSACSIHCVAYMCVLCLNSSILTDRAEVFVPSQQQKNSVIIWYDIYIYIYIYRPNFSTCAYMHMHTYIFLAMYMSFVYINVFMCLRNMYFMCMHVYITCIYIHNFFYPSFQHPHTASMSYHICVSYKHVLFKKMRFLKWDFFLVRCLLSAIGWGVRECVTCVSSGCNIW